jgi:uncharacterized membrane protein YcaP (DUF421 family)
MLFAQRWPDLWKAAGLLGGGTSTVLQVALRASLVYLAGYALLRLGEHRFVGKNTAFDVVLGFILGSTLSRAINGTAALFDTVAAGAVLLGLHWLFSTLAFRSDRLDALLNGEAVPLIQDGAVQWDTLRDQRNNERLLRENLRTRGHCDDPEAVRAAFYERSGEISILPAHPAPRIVEVKVEAGVQTVRIALE